MKIHNILVLVLFFIPALTFAGEIFGTINYENGKPCVKSTITITDDRGTVLKTITTDKYGYFSTSIQQKGQLNLKAEFIPEGNSQKYTAETKVYSNITATGYTFVIQKYKDQTWKLIRK